ncbi:MAG: hypothetical protein IT279_15065 [Ignavibacteriaceae bacterium]|nr:hypothetical protein [Ignavibacteriaceae bacterium]
MKNTLVLTLVVLLFSLFISSCSEENQVHNTLINPSSSKTDDDRMTWELGIRAVDNNDNPVEREFCVYKASDYSLHGCGFAYTWRDWVCDLVGDENTGDPSVPPLSFNTYYIIKAGPTYNEACFRIAFSSPCGLPGSYDTAMKFNVDTGQFTIERLGVCVTVNANYCR